MFSFAHPGLLYLLFLIPVFVVLFIWQRNNRLKNLKKFGKISVITKLMPDVSVYNPWFRLIFQMTALAAIIIACARPRMGEKEEIERTEGIEVMIAFDVSKSMLASATDDSNGVSRLERAKYILSRLIDKLDNDRIGLIVFAGQAYTQLPITTDFVSAKMYLNDLSTEMISSQGTAIGTAIEMALHSFTPDNTVGKAIIVITDGENHESDAVEMAKMAAEEGVQVDVIGIGSTKGSPIPLNSRRNDFLKDYNGEIVTTALNENMAREIATAGDGIYISGGSASAISELISQLDKLEKAELKHSNYKASAEQFPIFGWIALALLIADIFILDKKNSWLEKLNFFNRNI